VVYKSFVDPGRLAHYRSRYSSDSLTTGIRALVRLSGKREWGPSVDQASDVGDSHLRERLLGFKCK
jgi:hypothetical protein